MNILFVCSRNQWRSPTAEAIYSKQPGLNARSCGTEPSARTKASAKLIKWADLLFVMESRHRQRLLENFPEEMTDKNVVVLDIEDDFTFMDPELIDMIRLAVDPYLQHSAK